ncbi:MAG: hypothetical protein HY547_02805 [Elusimicrobia bacterium]|nr:hypothetical protein [Elusimicrobiota bacterium]
MRGGFLAYRKLGLIEIESAQEIQAKHARSLERFVRDFPSSQAYCFSRDPQPKKIGAVAVFLGRMVCAPWSLLLPHNNGSRGLRVSLLA